MYLSLLLSSPAFALDFCGDWDPGFGVAQKSGVESAALALSWTANAPTACQDITGDDWDGTDHMEIRRLEGTTSPGSPSAGVRAATKPANASDHADFLHRSAKDYAYTLFACENVLCTSWYADGSGYGESVTDVEDTAATATEMWTLEGVSGESDVTSNVVDNPLANAPHVFYYPSGWKAGYSDKLAFYYSVPAVWPDPSQVYFRRRTATGWPSGGFNVGSGWTSVTLVAEGSTDSDDEDYRADHPWAMLTQDGSDKRVQLFVHSQDVDNKQIIQIESDDEIGDDFGLSCSGGSCSTTILDGDGYVAVPADGTSATDYAVHAQHSRVAWDYIDDPIIDAGTDLPWMMFQIKGPASGACFDGGSYDDIGWVDGSWDSGAGEWDWAVETNLGTPYCPVIHIDDAHDNTSVPLPNGEFKLYYKDWSTNLFYVTYWVGAEWTDDVLIDFEWSGGGSGPDDKCVENVAAFAYVDSGTPREGMFFRLVDSIVCTGTGSTMVGLDDDDGLGDNDAAIVFAVHAN